MITLYRAAYQVEARAPEFTGLSTETKPVIIAGQTPMPNGAWFTEIDTGNKFRFDADTNTWLAQ